MAETIRTPVFNRYEVREKVGSGGMGTVYKAYDTHLNRCVALKVLPPVLQEHAEALERFKREARALARLKHPGVAAVYDASVAHGFPYLVLEFVEGATLEQVLRERGPLGIEEVVRLGLDLAEALEHIHRQRIIHRDVKPSNIIIGPEGRAVLADFGIALIASLPRISHGLLGTPEYMSPEQADGRPFDGRADLYSLGVVLYECLTGSVPFERAGESLAELTALMHHILEAPLPALQERREDVPAWLAAIIERCLAKPPENRYDQAADLARALGRGAVA
jgi:serine/threonine protein kinase